MTALAALEGGLGEAAAAFAEGSVIDAAAIMERVGAACRALADARAAVPPDAHARMTALHARCAEAAGAADRQLRDRVAQAASSRKAEGAYAGRRRR